MTLKVVAIVMLNSHLLSHQGANATLCNDSQMKQKLSQIPRPIVSKILMTKEWVTFLEEWLRFKRCTSILKGSHADQLFQCCERGLGRHIIKENPEVTEEGENALLEAIKQMAVMQVATIVRRNKLLQSKQNSGESFRDFFTNCKAVASTCLFQITCSHSCCTGKGPMDYTYMVVKNILVAGVLIKNC